MTTAQRALMGVGLVAGLSGTAAGQPEFTIQEITYPEDRAWIRDINDAGQVPVDAFGAFSGDHNAYVWQDGALTSLPSHPLSEDVSADSIDENGIVYGGYADPNVEPPLRLRLPMRWVDGLPEDLPLASETHFAIVARSSATTGLVAGSAHPFAAGTEGWENSYGWGRGLDGETDFGFEDPWRAMVWSETERTVLPRMPMGGGSWAIDVNDAGQVIVHDGIDARSWASLIDPQRGVIDLGSLGVGVGGGGYGQSTGTVAAAIDESGRVVGYSYVGFAAHPFLWEDGVMVDLGVPAGFAEAQATDINDRGDVVGRVREQLDPVNFDEDGAFLYSNGVMYNLQDLVPPDSGWQFTRAIAINNRGQILVAERLGNIFSSRYAVLTPAKAPGGEPQQPANQHQATMTAAAPAAGSAALGRTYTVTRLVDLPDATQSWALEVNSAGQVAGSFMTDGWKRTFGFVWQDGELIEQIVPTPGDQSATPPEIGTPAHHVEATAINDGGVVTGQAAIINFGLFVFPYFTPVPAQQEWPPLLNAALLLDSVAADITSTDPMLCVGWGWAPMDGASPRRAFGVLLTLDEGIGEPPQVEFIGGLGDFESGATAHAANAAWTIVGGVETAGGLLVAYRREWDRKQVETLGTLGGPSSEALGINAGGQIVGWSHTEPGRQHAFLYDAGQLIDLGTLGGPNSTAHGLNDDGRIVGEAWTASGDVHAFLYEQGEMLDLNDAIPAGTGWLLQRARAISNAGWIVGEGWIDGESHAFLLTPEAIVGDLDGDGTVGIKDFLQLLAAWGPCEDPGACPADLDGDGTVGKADLVLLLKNWTGLPR